MTSALVEPLEHRTLLAAYTITQLPFAAGGDTKPAFAINSGGATAGNVGQAAYLRGPTGKMYRIGSLPDDYATFSSGMNDLADVVGYGINRLGNRDAFLYHAGKLTRLPGLPDGGSAEAHAINNSGVIAGQVTPRTGKYIMAAFWQNGQLHPIGKVGVDSGTANDVNSAGQIVGQFGFHAFLYTNGQVKDLGTLGGGYSMAFAVNDSTEIVGASTKSGVMNMRGFAWSAGKMRDLGTLPGDTFSMAEDVNKSGTVVGQSWRASRGYRAVIWSAGSAITDLNSFVPGAGFTLVDAHAMNDAGQIVAAANNGHLYLLTPSSMATPTQPTQSPVTSAPPPSSTPAPLPPPPPAPISTPITTVPRQRGLISVTIGGDPSRTKDRLLA